jgi:glycosyltransferase involved in cell wall biosynthesis
MTKVAIDVRSLLQADKAGVPLYTLNLVRWLTMRSANDYCLFCNSYGAPFPEDAPPETEHVSHHMTRIPNKLFNASLMLSGNPKIDRLAGDADVLYLPNLNFASSKCPTVVTVHDLSFRRYPEFFSPKRRLWHKMIDPDRLISNAARVIAVSRHTKDDVIETYGVDESLIEVVSPAVSGAYVRQDEKRIEEARRRYILPKRYVLYLGTLEPRKNIEGLIDAFNMISSDIDLVIAGGKGWMYDRIFRKAKESAKHDRIHFAGYVKEEDKPALYTGARAFIYPSFYEGFGIPALEAMACGTPVVASHASSLGEVVGDAGLLVNPNDTEEIAQSIDRILEDKMLRIRFKEKGLERAAGFSWETGAQTLERVFREVALG